MRAELKEEKLRADALGAELAAAEAETCDIVMGGIWHPIERPAYKDPLCLLDFSSLEGFKDEVVPIAHSTLDMIYPDFAAKADYQAFLAEEGARIGRSEDQGQDCYHAERAAGSHRSTLALPPPTSFSTSARLAMVVSPGVVMASAPCAAPYSTASAALLPARKP